MNPPLCIDKLLKFFSKKFEQKYEPKKLLSDVNTPDDPPFSQIFEKRRGGHLEIWFWNLFLFIDSTEHIYQIFDRFNAAEQHDREVEIKMSHHSMSKREKWARAEEIHQSLVVKCQTSQQVYMQKKQTIKQEKLRNKLWKRILII